MAHASFSWQKFTSSLPAIDRRMLRRLDRFRGPGGWLMALTLIAALWLWNWPLVLATLIGLVSMVLAYGVQQYRWQDWQSEVWQKLWSRSNRQLTISVLLGGIATIATYIAAMVWLAADNGWLAAGTILQGLGTLAAVLLLLRQTWGQSEGQPTDEVQMLSRLSTADALDRLIAIRQVTLWAKAESPTLQAQVADCFQLLLQRESEPILQTALMDGLQALMPDRLGTGESSPVAIPIALQVDVKESA
ncbi:hypothetical protein H6F67_14435 [Microcoleus sp. FACHB-1515]|uniref:hypothetical protein n=1 Tax=Cyanophyceae TaxID=3028117 RepID=UPI0016881588|nr:hypothetical protein [Microcoleus sp. FACHB-1515]MBD2091048.1 hypothetical protein [Microcoleus sp. FACHB-1515]